MGNRIFMVVALAALLALFACSTSEKDSEKETGIIVEFAATPRSGDAPLVVQFSDQSTGENINAWSWSFGDGGTSTQQNPSHTYNGAGNYDVTLAVTNHRGTETLTRSSYIVVTGGGGGGTGTDFCFEPATASVLPGETVNFALANGTPPYQVGYANEADIQSYTDVSQMQGQVNTDTGVGYYIVGSNGNCTDILAAVDSNGTFCYLTITVGTSGGGGQPEPDPDPGTYTPTPGEMEIFDIVNQERQNVGRVALSWCDDLFNCARAHSNDMCDRGFFSHVNPEGEGPTDRGRAGHAGSYTFAPIVPNPYAWIGENIAYGYTDPQAIMEMWMNSTGHRNNILNPDYTHLGVGNCEGCGRHWTQCFGTR